MVKNIKGLVKIIFFYMLPIYVILGLVTHLKDIENFSLLGWINQLQYVLQNPIQPIIDFNNFVSAQMIEFAPTDTFFDRIVSSIQWLGLIGRNLGVFIFAILRCIEIILEDVIIFFNWLTLGFY